MKRSLALSLLAALSGSTYMAPTSAVPPVASKTTAATTQTADPIELSEKQRIMLEIRKQVGNELQDC